jgi:voltage-gated potassium channel Kch
MRKKKYRYLTAVIAFVLIYFLLLEVLVICERNNPEAHIQTLGDALWYSLVTLSTVGYGDVIPVSTPGHVV